MHNEEKIFTQVTPIKMSAEEAAEYSTCEHYTPRDLTGFQTHALNLVGYE